MNVLLNQIFVKEKKSGMRSQKSFSVFFFGGHFLRGERDLLTFNVSVKSLSKHGGGGASLFYQLSFRDYILSSHRNDCV